MIISWYNMYLDDFRCTSLKKQDQSAITRRMGWWFKIARLNHPRRQLEKKTVESHDNPKKSPWSHMRTPSGWWFQRFVFDSYFSRWLKPPTSHCHHFILVNSPLFSASWNPRTWSCRQWCRVTRMEWSHPKWPWACWCLWVLATHGFPWIHGENMGEWIPGESAEWFSMADQFQSGPTKEKRIGIISVMFRLVNCCIYSATYIYIWWWLWLSLPLLLHYVYYCYIYYCCCYYWNYHTYSCIFYIPYKVDTCCCYMSG